MGLLPPDYERGIFDAYVEKHIMIHFLLIFAAHFSFLFLSLFCLIIMYCHVHFVIWQCMFNDFYCCFINPGLFIESTPFLIFRSIIYQYQFRAGIICSPIWGSFPVRESFADWDHLQACTDRNRSSEI